MAHSLGGIVSFTYSSLFNDEIEFVISIDAKHSSLDIDSNTRQFRKNLKKFLEIEYLPISSVPSYSEDEAINRWRKSSNYSIDEQSCKELIIRGTRKKADGTVYFSRDPVLKFLTLSSFAYGQNVFKDMAKEIKNPYLVIKATDAKYVEKMKNVLEVADIIKENNMYFSFHKVPGTHHLHMTNPHAVVEIINPFLEKYNN
ncbi:probable serine hydrolase [Cephus cinctus]|uniref:Probable serine hydrolase n=1 Tax=Cephus cinctus TaxID=211228 RepID=A0AAJ7BX38_CEPCN|nr:probable serine hydrolase [Cephus cinctus]XP_015596415.1 probable serine hydrolase [Cephus cinctus]XP_024941368.1 probable serine hydrolase [Cephus cinctus]